MSPSRFHRLTTVFTTAMLALSTAGCTIQVDTQAGDPSPSTRPSAPAPATSTTATSGQTVYGSGYGFALPSGWRDVTNQSKKDFTEKIDLWASGPKSGGFNPGVIVAFDPSRGLSLADVVAATRKDQAETLHAQFLGQPRQFSLAGTPALVWELIVPADPPYQIRLIACLRGDRALFVTFAAAVKTFTTDRAALDQMTTSWIWGAATATPVATSP
jgi:hypothetical protein